MFYQDILLRETAGLPDYLKRELLDFLFFLKRKNASKSLSALDPNLPPIKPAFGCGRVNIKVSPDFDAPLDDFKGYMQ